MPTLTIVANATVRTSPGSACTHTMTASAAMKSSTSMPAAPTTMRWRLSGKAHAAEASTYGTGVTTIIMMPMSWTSPPKALTATACPSSWSTLTTGNSSAKATRPGTDQTRSTASPVKSRQWTASRPTAVTTVASHRAAASPPRNGRPPGTVRCRNASGSTSGIRHVKRLSICPATRRRRRCRDRSNSSTASGVTSH